MDTHRHLKEQDQAILYVDGRASTNSYNLSASDLNVTATGSGSVLLDEVRIYDVPLSEAEIRYLAGRTYLDLSGNKYHAPPVGSDDFYLSVRNQLQQGTIMYPNICLIQIQAMVLVGWETHLQEN